MKPLVTALFLGMLAVLGGCSAVYAPAAPGDRAYATPAADWNGTWVNKDGPVSVRVVDAGAGHLRVAWLEWKGDQPALNIQDVFMRSDGRHLLAAVKVTRDNDKARWVWALVRRNGRQLVGWLPDSTRFKTLVEAGKLPGRVAHGDVLLGHMDAAQAKALVDDPDGTLYARDAPLVFLRLVPERR